MSSKFSNVDATRKVGSVVVHRYRIIGTPRVVHAVYVPGATYFSEFSTTFRIDGVLCGKLTSKQIPANVNALPVGPARFAACDAHRSELEEQAYRAIVEAFPDAAHGAREHGDIVTEVA